MKLIAGLGNPGREYERTPHNVGYDVVDLLCHTLEGSWRSSAKHEGQVARVSLEGEGLLLVKPLTFMNASGRCVGSLARYHRVAPQDVVAVLDDVELPPGRLRIRPEGGDGGHNGLLSLADGLGTTAFPRLRVGVGRGAPERRELIGHVLGRFAPETQALIDRVLPVAVEALLLLVRHGVPEAMNRYNGFSVEALRPAADPAPAGTASARALKEQGAEIHVEKV